MMDIMKIPEFPVKMLFEYIYSTSIEDYFRFLAQKVQAFDEMEYKIIRDQLCCIHGVHKAESLHKLMDAMRASVNKISDELNDLYDEQDMYGYGDESSEKKDCDMRVKNKRHEWYSLHMYLYMMFVQPLLSVLGDTGTWTGQMKYRLSNYTTLN